MTNKHFFFDWGLGVGAGSPYWRLASDVTPKAWREDHNEEICRKMGGACHPGTAEERAEQRRQTLAENPRFPEERE